MHLNDSEASNNDNNYNNYSIHKLFQVVANAAAADADAARLNIEMKSELNAPFASNAAQ